MGEVLPCLCIERIIAEGKCDVRYTFQPGTLALILEQAGVATAGELPDEFLRELCRRATPAQQLRDMERVEELHPGETAVVLNRDAHGNPIELRSSQVGFDMMKRFTDEGDPEIDILCDPTYNPVGLEIRVFDMSPMASTDPASNLGSCVFRTTLQPPSLT